jgi:hypothetical protein
LPSSKNNITSSQTHCVNAGVSNRLSITWVVGNEERPA